MAFLFKSKKHQDRALAGGREGMNGSQGSMNSPDARARVVRDEKGMHRSTPTGSVNSIDNEGSNASPDQFSHGPLRRAQTGDPPSSTASSDMPPQVSQHTREQTTSPPTFSSARCIAHIKSLQEPPTSFHACSLIFCK